MRVSNPTARATSRTSAPVASQMADTEESQFTIFLSTVELFSLDVLHTLLPKINAFVAETSNFYAFYALEIMNEDLTRIDARDSLSEECIGYELAQLTAPRVRCEDAFAGHPRSVHFHLNNFSVVTFLFLLIFSSFIVVFMPPNSANVATEPT